MIDIIQKPLQLNSIGHYTNKNNEVRLSLDENLIVQDIARLNEMQHNTCNKYDEKNIDDLKAYLEDLLEQLDNGEIALRWKFKDERLKSKPVQLINEKVYGIDTCNYIKLDNKHKLVEINLKELADIISFELMSRDLGETHESIEDLLKDCGILASVDSSILIDMFNDNNDDMYGLSKNMRVDDSPYILHDEKKIKDYFGTKKFRINTYKDAVEQSCRYAVLVIMNDIFKKAVASSIKVNIVMANATNLAFIANCSEEIIREKLLDKITVRAFGRKFMINVETIIL